MMGTSCGCGGRAVVPFYRVGEAAGRVVMAAVVRFQSGGRLWKERRGGWHRVMRGNEGDEMPVQFSYSRAEESGHRRRTARWRRPTEAVARESGGGRRPRAGLKGHDWAGWDAGLKGFFRQK
jgi:hypothetical protein